MTSEVLSTKWSSSNSSVVSIAGGVMYAKKNGKANVTISQKVKYSHEYNECIPGSDGYWKTIKKKKTWTDTVKEEFLVVVSKRQFSLNKTSLYMKVGKTDTITLKNTVASTEVVWSSSNPGVASIRETGEHNQYCIVTAEKKGTALIKAKVGKQSYSCKVTVIESEDATGIELVPKEAVVHVGGSKAFKLKGAVASKVKWSVSNPGVASISKKGKVTGKAVGLTYVYASYKGTKYVAECWVDP